MNTKNLKDNLALDEFGHQLSFYPYLASLSPVFLVKILYQFASREIKDEALLCSISHYELDLNPLTKQDTLSPFNLIKENKTLQWACFYFMSLGLMQELLTQYELVLKEEYCIDEKSCLAMGFVAYLAHIGILKKINRLDKKLSIYRLSSLDFVPQDENILWQKQARDNNTIYHIKALCMLSGLTLFGAYFESLIAKEAISLGIIQNKANYILACLKNLSAQVKSKWPINIHIMALIVFILGFMAHKGEGSFFNLCFLLDKSSIKSKLQAYTHGNKHALELYKKAQEILHTINEDNVSAQHLAKLYCALNMGLLNQQEASIFYQDTSMLKQFITSIKQKQQLNSAYHIEIKNALAQAQIINNSALFDKVNALSSYIEQFALRVAFADRKGWVFFYFIHEPIYEDLKEEIEFMRLKIQCANHLLLFNPPNLKSIHHHRHIAMSFNLQEQTLSKSKSLYYVQTSAKINQLRQSAQNFTHLYA